MQIEDQADELGTGPKGGHRGVVGLGQDADVAVARQGTVIPVILLALLGGGLFVLGFLVAQALERRRPGLTRRRRLAAQVGVDDVDRRRTRRVPQQSTSDLPALRGA